MDIFQQQGEFMRGQDLATLALEKIKNKYLLTILVSRRVNQLKQGAKPLIQEADSLTPYNIALKEIVAGKITPERSHSPEGASPTEQPTESGAQQAETGSQPERAEQGI
jgi:DNA-directed RNA polymerase omega subunit